MAVLEVDPESLHVLATRCSALAADVATMSAVSLEGGASGQPTGAAVQTLRAGVNSAAQVFAARLLSTSAALSAGGAAFLNHDVSAVADLTAVLPPEA